MLEEPETSFGSFQKYVKIILAILERTNIILTTVKFT